MPTTLPTREEKAESAAQASRMAIPAVADYARTPPRPRFAEEPFIDPSLAWAVTG